MLARAGRGVRFPGAVPSLQARGGRGVAMRNPLGKWALLALISSSVLVADQVTKFMAVEQLTYAFQAARARTLPEKVEAFLTQKDLLERGLSDGRQIQVIRNFWQFQYTQNRGARRGSLRRDGRLGTSDASGALQRGAFALLGAARRRGAFAPFGRLASARVTRRRRPLEEGAAGRRALGRRDGGRPLPRREDARRSGEQRSPPPEAAAGDPAAHLRSLDRHRVPGGDAARRPRRTAPRARTLAGDGILLLDPARRDGGFARPVHHRELGGLRARSRQHLRLLEGR